MIKRVNVRVKHTNVYPDLKYIFPSLPIIPRKDLSYDETIVLELNFERKKIFFTVLHQSSAFLLLFDIFQTHENGLQIKEN